MVNINLEIENIILNKMGNTEQNRRNVKTAVNSIFEMLDNNLLKITQIIPNEKEIRY